MLRIKKLLPILLLLASTNETMARSAKASNLEGMDYDRARSLILSYGWTPFRGDCNGVDENTCARYPEVGNCQMVSPGYCDMSFTKDKRCLIVVTLESPPGASRGETWVKNVTFLRMPCQNEES